MKHLLFILLLVIIPPLSSWCSTGKIKWTPEEQHWINQHMEISFGYEPRWEPYEIYENGKYGGIVSDYLKIISQETGITFKPIPNLSWRKSLNGLKNGTIKMVPCCAITPERKKYLRFSDVYIDDPIVIVTRDDGPYVSKLSDLKESSIALSHDYYTIELIKEKYSDIEILKKENIEACLQSVLDGETVAFVGNLNVIMYYMNNMGYGKLKIVGTTDLDAGEIALAVTPDWKMFTQIVNKVLNSIDAKRKHEIRKEWIAPTNLNSFFSGNSLIWIIVIIASVLVGFSILYYWNNVLRGIVQRKKRTEQQLKESLIELKRNDEEKKVLLQEIHHRVKNNLQVVSSMMRVQANIIKDANASRTLKESVERIKTIALVHDRIYKSPDINTVSLKDYIDSLFKDILLQFEGIDIPEIKLAGDDIDVKMDKIVPLALILNELITNSIKYAFKDQPSPLITITTKRSKDSGLKLVFEDNGHWVENEDSDMFGTSLIGIFTDQLEGSYELNKTPEGTSYHFQFFSPISKDSE